MKREESDKVIAELGRIIGEALGGGVDVEVIKVPHGQTLEDVIDERRGESVEAKQAKAIRAIDERIAHLQQVIDKLRSLQTSIAQPMEERKPTQTMEEVMLALNIERMIQAL